MTADAIADGPEPEDDETEQPPVHARLGEYRLVQRLGEGGMGVVHLALDRHGRAVAIKVLRQHIAHDPDARARLTREVSTLSRITSPRVAPIIDADVDGPTPYIVTRYVPGPSLDDYVAERGLLPPADLHRVASGLAEALDAIHSAGVVHRDVKPGNVLLVDGDPVLIDFGIAHVADDIRLTMTGLVMGTPGYLAPEVVGGDDVTARHRLVGLGRHDRLRRQRHPAVRHRADERRARPGERRRPRPRGGRPAHRAAALRGALAEPERAPAPRRGRRGPGALRPRGAGHRGDPGAPGAARDPAPLRAADHRPAAAPSAAARAPARSRR